MDEDKLLLFDQLMGMRSKEHTGGRKKSLSETLLD